MLFLFVWGMDHEQFVLNDKGRNAAAFELLREVVYGVSDELRQQCVMPFLRKPCNDCTRTTC